MKDTYLQYQNHGFWIRQDFVEVLSDYICETFEGVGINNLSPNLQKMYSICDSNRLGEFIGMVGIAFNRLITNDDDKRVLIDLLQQTKILILSKGIELSTTTLEDFENRKSDDYFKSPWYYPIKTASLATTIDMIIQLLNGTWHLDRYGVYYSGFPNPTGQPEI
jgi:hypothetical protein